MIEVPLNSSECEYLLMLARLSIELGVKRLSPPELDESQLTASLRAMGASFVTLTIHNQLRGCIGALEAFQSLAEDVREHARAAALEDYRFPPVRQEEVALLHLEINRLTTPMPIKYENPEELLSKIQQGLHGIVLKDGFRKATFLPQVWKELPDPQEFLDHLCYKMGAAPDLWRRKLLQVSLYQVEEFAE
jgi:AmmeMemoRadiSam system protein A